METSLNKRLGEKHRQLTNLLYSSKLFLAKPEMTKSWVIHETGTEVTNASFFHLNLTTVA